MERMDLKIGTAIGLCFVALNLVGLDRSPLVWLDEVILNDAGKELALHGKFRSEVMADSWGTGNSYFFQPPGQALVSAAVYKAFGFGIWQTRIPSVVFGGAVLVVLFAASLQLFQSRRAAFFATLLLGLDPKFIQIARCGRMDMQCMFLVLAGLLVFLGSRSGGRRRYLSTALSGVLVGLGGITHPTAAFWAAGMLAFISLSGEKGKIRQLVVFGSFAALPALIWLAYALRTPELFTRQFLTHGIRHVAGGPLFHRFAAELLRYPKAYARAPLLLVAYCAGLGWLLIDRRVEPSAKRCIGLMFGVILILDSMIMVKNRGYYYIDSVIFLALAAGLMFERILPPGWTRPSGARSAVYAAVIVLVIANELIAGIAGRYVALAYQWRARDYRQVEQGVKKYIPPGSVVLGPSILWYAAEENGVVLRMSRRFAPRRYDYVVTRAGILRKVPPMLTKVGEFGRPLPPLMGGYAPSKYDYHLEVWRCAEGPASRIGPVPARPAESMNKEGK